MYREIPCETVTRGDLPSGPIAVTERGSVAVAGEVGEDGEFLERARSTYGKWRYTSSRVRNLTRIAVLPLMIMPKRSPSRGRDAQSNAVVVALRLQFLDSADLG